MYKYNFDSKKIEEYSDNNAKGKSLGRRFKSFIFEDKKNRIPVGTFRGLSLYNPKSDSFTTYYVDPENKGGQNNYFVSSYEDNAGNLTFGIWNTTESYTSYYSFSLDEITGKETFTNNPDYDISLVLKN